MASSASSSLARSSYVSRLRRAFLLRAHPDRFDRSRYDASVRRKQAELVQALSARLSSPDFAAYARPDGGAPPPPGFDAKSWRSGGGGGGAPWDGAGGGGEGGAHGGRYDFVLERRDGSLLRRTMDLDDTAEGVLRSMADALLRSGAPKSSIPDPPPAPRPSSPDDDAGTARRTSDGGDRRSGWAWAAPPDAPQTGVDHRFDVNSRAGRDLLGFLRSPAASPSQIDRRRARRLDAHSAALAARRAYGFLSVDGTSVGWSSASLAACLGRLTELRAEYGDRLNVASFYPLRLVIGYEDGYSDPLDEFRDSLRRAGTEDGSRGGAGDGDGKSAPADGAGEGRGSDADPGRAVDLYGGTVTLHPSATSLQWLKVLASVRDESIEIYKAHSERLRRYGDVVRDVLNVKVRRGHTCRPEEYHGFMARLAGVLRPGVEEGGNDADDDEEEVAAAAAGTLATTSAGLSLDEPTHLSVESDASCRRGVVTPEGTVRVGVGMSAQAVVGALSRLGERARRNAEVRSEAEGRCREAMRTTKAELGLTNVYRAALGAVTADQTAECLYRLLGRVRGGGDGGSGGGGSGGGGAAEDDECDGSGEEMRYRLAGNALGVTGRGRFCHLGDDGSIVIPCDWR